MDLERPSITGTGRQRPLMVIRVCAMIDADIIRDRYNFHYTRYLRMRGNMVMISKTSMVRGYSGQTEGCIVRLTRFGTTRGEVTENRT